MSRKQTAASKKTDATAPAILQTPADAIIDAATPKQPSAMDFAVQQLSAPVAPKLTAEMQKIVDAAVEAATPKGKKASTPRVARIEQNGVKRPNAGGACAAVWEKADALSASLERPVTVAELRNAMPEQNKNNLQAEYAAWRKFNGIIGRLPVVAKVAKPASVVMTHEGNP